MSIWNEGRYQANVKWIAQLLYNGGVDELQGWLDTQEQHVKDDICILLEQLSKHVKSQCEIKATEGTYIRPIVNEIKPIKKPHLRVIKDSDEISD